MSLERRQSTDINYGFEQPRISVPATIEQVGFSSRFVERLRELNHVLGTIGKPQVEGFNLELLPDIVSPTVEVNLNVKNPFKLEVMGTREYAAVRVFNNITATELHIADVQEFTRSSFPGRKIILCCLPRRLSEREGLLVTSYTRIPRSFYEEEQDSYWQRLVEEDYSRKRVRLGWEMFSPVEMDLYGATEELLANLQSSHEDKARLIFDVDLTGKLANFPYEKFQVYLNKEKRPLLELRGNSLRSYRPVGSTEGVPSFWFFSQLHFRGKPQNVERVIGQFTELLKKTPQYKKVAADGSDDENKRIKKLSKIRRRRQEHE